MKRHHNYLTGILLLLAMYLMAACSGPTEHKTKKNPSGPVATEEQPIISDGDMDE